MYIDNDDNSLTKDEKYLHLENEEKWSEARNVLIEMLNNDSTDHWVLTKIGETYYEEQNYEKSLEYSTEALKIAPDCPLVLWDHAGSLDMIGKSEESIIMFKKITRKSLSEIAYGECGEGIRWARSIFNDCHYRIGLLYARIGKFKLAEKHISKYISQRNHNCTSIYDLRKVKKDLLSIHSHKDPRKT